jgi:hypothetical protein
MDCRREEGRLLTSSVFRAGRPSMVLKGFAFGLVLVGLASATAAFAADPAPWVVPKAKCGPNDHPETGVQGQVPAPLRASGFQGFSCNLELLSQVKIDGGNWQSAEWRERGNNGNGKGDGLLHKGNGRVCGYHTTASPTLSRPGRNPATLGVPVVDFTDPKNPVTTGFLQTTSMLDPWESLKVNERRGLLGADNGQNGGGGPQIDIYDVSQDCRFPQLLASAPVGTGADGGLVHTVTGHEGTFSPDGLTWYGGDLGRGRQFFAADISDATRPRLIAAWQIGMSDIGSSAHGMSISEDGMRGYMAVTGSSGGVSKIGDPTVPANNGLVIYDLSQIQNRVPNPQVTVVSRLLWKDGSTAQMTIPVTIKGHKYVVFADEGGTGGGTSAAQLAASCAAGMPMFPMARIINIDDEKNPFIVSRLGLETHDPQNCASVMADLVGLSIFTYGSHYCSVDNKHNATTLACGYFNSGIRVFDIRDPNRPKEIAYYNPAGTTTPSPGSNHAAFGFRAGGPDWCSAQVHMNADNGTLWSSCQDNGFLMLKFTNNVWPFPDTKTPAGGSDNGSD